MRGACVLVLCVVKLAAGGSAAGAGEGEGYCDARHDELCRNKGPHVACQYPNEGPGVLCENYSALHMTRDLRLFITHYINRRRQRLAEGNERGRGGIQFPQPSVMMLVEWDTELARLAQRLADQCRFAHDHCRATIRYPYAGQTVGEVRWRGAAGRAVRRVLDAWWGERSAASPSDLASPFRVNSSQMAVWSLRAVGCGAAVHDDTSGAATMLLVCDYSHNNMLGQRTVEVGPRAACPAHAARRPHSPYPLLCAVLSPYEPEEDDPPPSKPSFHPHRPPPHSHSKSVSSWYKHSSAPVSTSLQKYRPSFSTEELKYELDEEESSEMPTIPPPPAELRALQRTEDVPVKVPSVHRRKKPRIHPKKLEQASSSYASQSRLHWLTTAHASAAKHSSSEYETNPKMEMALQHRSHNHKYSSSSQQPKSNLRTSQRSDLPSLRSHSPSDVRSRKQPDLRSRPHLDHHKSNHRSHQHLDPDKDHPSSPGSHHQSKLRSQYRSDPLSVHRSDLPSHRRSDVLSRDRSDFSSHHRSDLSSQHHSDLSSQHQSDISSQHHSDLPPHHKSGIHSQQRTDFRSQDFSDSLSHHISDPTSHHRSDSQQSDDPIQQQSDYRLLPQSNRRPSHQLHQDQHSRVDETDEQLFHDTGFRRYR